MDTIMALYDNVSHAQQAAERLVGQGIRPRRIMLHLQAVAPIFHAAKEAAGDDSSADEQLKQGGALVAVELDDANSNQVWETLEQYGYVHAVTLPSDEAQRIRRATTPDLHPGDFWIEVEAAFKRHFHANYEAKGYQFETYEPAYRFGFAMAGEPGRGQASWEDAAPRLQEAWDARYPGDWRQFSAAIHHGWQVARGRHLDQEPDVTEIQTTRRGAQYRELNEEQ